KCYYSFNNISFLLFIYLFIKNMYDGLKKKYEICFLQIIQNPLYVVRHLFVVHLYKKNSEKGKNCIVKWKNSLLKFRPRHVVNWSDENSEIGLNISMDWSLRL